MNDFSAEMPEFFLVMGSPRTGTTLVMDWLGNSVREEKVWVRESGVPCLVHLLFSAMEYERRDHRWGVDLVLDLPLRAVLAGQVQAMGLALYGKFGWQPGLPIFDKEPYFGPDGGLFYAHLREAFPKMKAIYMVRNPLSVLSSMLRRTWGRGPFPRVNRLAPFAYGVSSLENSICDEVPGGAEAWELRKSSLCSLRKCCVNYRNAVNTGVALLEDARVLFLNYEDLHATAKVRERVAEFIGRELVEELDFAERSIPMEFTSVEEEIIRVELVETGTWERYEALRERAAKDLRV